MTVAREWIPYQMNFASASSTPTPAGADASRHRRRADLGSGLTERGAIFRGHDWPALPSSTSRAAPSRRCRLARRRFPARRHPISTTSPTSACVPYHQLVVTCETGSSQPGKHRLETPIETAARDRWVRVSIENVPSYRSARGVVEVPGRDHWRAWGGNWFFLMTDAELAPNVERLGPTTPSGFGMIRQAHGSGWSRDRPRRPTGLRATLQPRRNFVPLSGQGLRSLAMRTGIGKKARLPTLTASSAGRRLTGECDRQVFEGSVRVLDGKVIPRITGSAFVTAEATLILDPADPFRTGLPT